MATDMNFKYAVYYIISLIYMTSLTFSLLGVFRFSSNFSDMSYIILLLLLLWNLWNIPQKHYWKLGHKTCRHCIQGEMEIEATTKSGFYSTGLPAPLKKKNYYTGYIQVTAISHSHTNFMNISMLSYKHFELLSIIVTTEVYYLFVTF